MHASTRQDWVLTGLENAVELRERRESIGRCPSGENDRWVMLQAFEDAVYGNQANQKERREEEKQRLNLRRQRHDRVSVRLRMIDGDGKAMARLVLVP